MGYFSNGTEHECYEAEFCEQCANFDSGMCAVMLAHMECNYQECNNPDSILHMLIPRRKDGLGNEKCKMFRVQQ